MKLFKSLICALGLMVLVSTGGLKAQSFDPYSQQGNEFTTAIITMLWLGAAQSIVEQCNGDVSIIGNKLILIFDAAKVSRGEEFANMLAGIFGEAMQMSSQMGCDAGKIQLYQGWSDLYYQPLLSKLRGN